MGVETVRLSAELKLLSNLMKIWHDQTRVRRWKFAAKREQKRAVQNDWTANSNLLYQINYVCKKYGRLVIWTFYVGKGLMRNKERKVYDAKPTKCKDTSSAVRAKRLRSQSKGSLNELFMMGMELLVVISSKSHRYIVNVLLKSVRVFRAKFL